MSEKAPQINAEKFVKDVVRDQLPPSQARGFNRLKGSSGEESGYASIQGFSPEDGSVVMNHDSPAESSSISYRTKGMHGYSEHANSSKTTGETWSSYRGDITPRKYGIEPQVTRVHTDPTTGEKTQYEHTFKDTQKAGQLIAKLAASRINRELENAPKDSAELDQAA